MANNPTLLTRPLAEDGQKNTIPDTTDATSGLFSQQYGWQSINSLPLQAGGKAVKREDFNGAFNLLGGIAFMAQKGFTFKWSATQDYYAGCVVIDDTDGLRYECIADVTANTTAPSADAMHWQIFKAGTDIDAWFRQASTVYAVGDLRCYESLPYGWYLECTTPGTTDSGDITLPSPVVENATVTDGTVTWEIRKTADTQGLATKADINGSNMVYHKDVITTSGTYTAPVTGLYKITVKGGGGGGGNGYDGGSTLVYVGGSGGGEGGTTISYEHIDAGTSVAVSIGAGGSGGTSIGDGTDGGDTMVTVNGNTYTGGGGKHGESALTTNTNSGAGGTGTIQGAAGGSVVPAYNSIPAGGSGGGVGGGFGRISAAPVAGINGGGGAGGAGQNNVAYACGAAGGDGFAWFEYYTPGA